MRANAVTHALCIGVEMDAWPRVHAIALSADNLFASVGVHPDYTDQPEPTVELLVAKSRELENGTRAIRRLRFTKRWPMSTATRLAKSAAGLGGMAWSRSENS